MNFLWMSIPVVWNYWRKFRSPFVSFLDLHGTPLFLSNLVSEKNKRVSDSQRKGFRGEVFLSVTGSSFRKFLQQRSCFRKKKNGSTINIFTFATRVLFRKHSPGCRKRRMSAPLYTRASIATRRMFQKHSSGCRNRQRSARCETSLLSCWSRGNYSECWFRGGALIPAAGDVPWRGSDDVSVDLCNKVLDAKPWAQEASYCEGAQLAGTVGRRCFGWHPTVAEVADLISLSSGGRVALPFFLPCSVL